MSSRRNKVFIVQRPKHGDNFDMEAIEALGEIEYLLPAAPNAHDQEMIANDIQHMASRIREAGPSDVFIILGGSPVSQVMFGEALAHADVRSYNFGLYSRAQDRDGRRGGQRGSYRIIPMTYAGRLSQAH